MQLLRRLPHLFGKRAARKGQCVLGLATGSTPVGIYNELVRMHQEEGLSLANVVTFNLDEYFPMQPDELQSYIRFMREHFFDRCDIPEDQWHVPDGTIPVESVGEYCGQYEEKIKAVGGIDIQLLGIGRTGHIGFNEPGSGKESRTRMITLDRVTRTDAASDFFGQENVPRRALTMGVGTILEARQVVMLAFGEHKSDIVARAVEGEMTPSIAASFLQDHPNAEVFLDEAAANALTRCRSPWLLGPVQVGTIASSQSGHLASSKTGQADSETDRRRLQRRRPARSAGRARSCLPNQHRDFPAFADDDHGMARGEAR